MNAAEQPTTAPQIAVEPPCWRREVLAEAVEAGGGQVVAADQAEAVVWAEPARPDLLPPVLDANPQIEWVQLPYAGVESFLEMLSARPDLEWTCGKGVYARPVAEHVMTLALAGMRGLGTYVPAKTWEAPEGRNLIGARVTVLGGGGITECLLPMLAPFDCEVTVLRKNVAEQLPGAKVRPIEDLHAVLGETDLLVLALALTPETTGIVGAAEFERLPEHAWVINVARGKHIVTADLVAALQEGQIGGAGLDVTDPEPLDDDHPLWSLPNCIITPHVANTPEMGLPLLADRVRENVARRATGESLIGHVNIGLGY